MPIVVTKSPAVVVRPSEPVTPAAGKINLSPFDKPFSIIPVNVLLAFDHSINEPVETIRKSLSQALVHYYPIAGRLAGDDYNDIHIDCTGDDDRGGVTFVAASANCTVNYLMRDIDGRSPDPSTALLHDLLVDYPSAMGCFGHGDPLLLMQVTAFSCGGFVVGVTWNHGIADGFGVAQFLQAVGDLARGMPAPAVVPVRWDASTQAVSPSFVLAGKRFIFGCKPSSDLALQSITIPAGKIDTIRGSSSSTCTMFEAVAATLWRCRTRVVMTDPEAPTVLVFSVNSRKLIGVKEGYYGNCVTVQMAVAKSGAVANGQIVDVVRMIRRAKEEIPERLKKGDVAQAIGELSEQQVAGYESVLLLTCWRNIGFEGVDFGGGGKSSTPARVMTMYEHSQVRPMCVVCLPCKCEEGGGGARVLSSCVTAHHADAFLREIAAL